jgi:LPXTG-motif cell wall-anchored protein
MENLNLNNQNLLIIAGVVFVLIVVIILIIRRKKKKGSGKKKKKNDKVEFQEVIGIKYKGEDPTDEELEVAPRLIIEKFDDSPTSLSFRIKVKGPKIKLDEIDPYDNYWINILDYNDLVGQVRSDGDILHVYMIRKNRFRPSKPEKAVINIVYRQDGGKQWIQQIKYNSKSGVKLGALKTLN